MRALSVCLCLCLIAVSHAAYTPGQAHGREHQGEIYAGEAAAYDVRTNLDQGTDSLDLDGLSPSEAADTVDEHHEDIEDKRMEIAHDDHSLAGEDVKTLPNLEYDGKGAAGYDFGDNVLNIAQVPMGNVVEPPHKHANHRGVDGGSHENGHNSGVVINGGSGEVDTSGMPNDEPKVGMQGWFIVALVLSFFFLLGCGLWCNWLHRQGIDIDGNSVALPAQPKADEGQML